VCWDWSQSWRTESCAAKRVWLRSIKAHCSSDKLENVWQSLAYSPLGAVVSPLANANEQTLTYWLPPCLAAPPPTKRTWSHPRKIFYVDCTTSYVLNSGVTELNLTKFLQDVQRWLLITLLKSKLWSSNQFRNASTKWTTIVESQYDFHFLPLLNSKTTGPISTIFSHDVKLLVWLLMRVSARQFCIPFQNARTKSDDGQFWSLQTAHQN